jgi:hypothetical protein
MSSATSVIRRYTPPTCTLEISGKDSPLSRWMGRSALKNVRFNLSFDDPRVGEDRWVSVNGDRIQLQSLCDAVTNYVQRFLHQSSNLVNSAIASSGSPTASTAAPEFITSESEGNFAGIFLEPRGMLSHELHLGTLANETSGSSIPLSAVQLADLASALDEYSADVTALPSLNNRHSWASNPPAWGKIAAVSLLAIGLSTAVLRGLEQKSPTTQTATEQAPPSSSDQRLAVQPLPSPSASPLGPLVPTTPLPPGSLPTTQVPEAGISAPPAPQQAPDIKVTEKSAPGSQTTAPSPTQGQSQPGIAISEVPESGVRVPPVPDQTGRSASSAPAGKKAPASSQGEPEPPAPSAADSVAAAERIGSPAALNAPSAPPPQQAARDISAFPQVGEVESFFQKNWKPTPTLKDEAQYNLALSPKGTVQTIIPLNEAARVYQSDLERLLTKDTQVASPPRDARPSVVRIFLNPSGAVKVMQP